MLPVLLISNLRFFLHRTPRMPSLTRFEVQATHLNQDFGHEHVRLKLQVSRPVLQDFGEERVQTFEGVVHIGFQREL